MKTHWTPDQSRYPRMTTEELRAGFVLESLFRPGAVELVYTDLDRAVVGSVVPTSAPLELIASRQHMAADFFCERREVGFINIGGPGSITVDQKKFEMDRGDGLYVGRGSRRVECASRAEAEPAQFYLVSYPAHRDYPTAHARKAEAQATPLGTPATANVRTIFKYIHPQGIPSCQLVMGFTQLAEGSVWNTMPPHTHLRRSEVYLYYDVDPAAQVVHLMGTPQESRHLMMKQGQAALSPSWSIHAGAGTRGYSFIWAMGGENQAFDDMDAVPIASLR